MYEPGGCEYSVIPNSGNGPDGVNEGSGSGGSAAVLV